MNFIVLVVDTLRYDHIGAFGLKPILTPNLDRFSKRATIFDNAYIGSFPTIPHRTDTITGNVIFPRYDWRTLAPEEVTLPEVLRDKGYYTAFIADTGHMFRAEFDKRFDEAHKTWNPPATNPKPADMPFLIPPETVRQDGAEYRAHMAAMAHYKHESDWFVAQTMTRAADWLQDNAAGPGKRDKWMLWVDTFEVHEWWHTPDYYVNLYNPDYKDEYDYDFPNYGYTDIYQKKHIQRLAAHYAAEVSLTDRWIGHLLDQITLMNLWDDTTVIITSDHGMYLGEHRRMGKHTVRGAEDPWPLYNEVSHIPLLLWSPGASERSRRLNAMVQPADLMPTILDAARARGPKMSGRSLLPLLTRHKRAHWDVVYSSKHNGDNAKNSFYPSWLTATTRFWTYIAAEPGHPAELYDNKNDPGQQHNVVRQHADIAARFQTGVVEFLGSQGATEGYVARFRQA